MAKICNSTLQPSGLVLNENLNGDFLTKCKFELHSPTVNPFDVALKPLKETMREDESRQKKAKFQCPHRDHNRRTESGRKQILQKLKKIYNINVDDLNENVTNEIITKIDRLEKEKKERKKRKVERTMKILNTLLEEQKYKRRGIKFHTPPWRKRAKTIPSSERVCQSLKEEKTGGGSEDVDGALAQNYISMEKEKETQKLTKRVSTEKSTEGRKSNFGEEIRKTPQKQQQEDELHQSSKYLLPIEPDGLVSFKKSLVHLVSCAHLPIENNLECTPKRIVFEDWKKGRVYLQNLKITNVSLVTIYCRYLGILVHLKGEERFPVGVAVRNNVKLKPGLSFSTKVRFCSEDVSTELECSIVYETRRQNKPLQHSCFLVSVVCIPATAIVKIMPLKIVFPVLTWCSAMGAEGSKLLTKVFKIENTGGRACSCKISSLMNGREIGELSEEGEVQEEEGEMQEEEGDVLKTKTPTSPGTFEESATGEEVFGGWDEVLKSADSLLSELIDNVFATFRFSEKYHIEIPPFSIKQIEVRFTPEYRGYHHELFCIQFEGCDNCKEETIELIGNIKNLPIRALPHVIDLKTCVANSCVLAGTFKVFNYSKGPYSVRIKIPPAVRNHAHVYPRATTIQAFSHCDVSVRIYPRVTISRDTCPYYTEDSKILEFPVFIHSANAGTCKLDYIKAFVFALITDYALELSPPEIDFGTVTTVETVRTQIEITNHSLAAQEYGFLNLPKGVRVEPNMGFGSILPKESIVLYLLYSPEINSIESSEEHEKMDQKSHFFHVEVTTIAEYGGFREKLKPEEEKTTETFQSTWGEEFECDSSKPVDVLFLDKPAEKFEAEETEDDDACDEKDFTMEGEELSAKIQEQERKIRDYLKQDRDKMSEHSFFKRINLKPRKSDDLQSAKGTEHGRNTRKRNNASTSPITESEQNGEYVWDSFGRPQMHVIKCRAVVLEPYCQISESVVQLPATPCSSFSLYRFRLNGSNDSINASCTCGLRNVKKSNLCVDKPKFEAAFEFRFFCPQIKIEPQSGFFKSGESLPITIIYRPEFPAEQLLEESRAQKCKAFLETYTKEETETDDYKTVPNATSTHRKNPASPCSRRKLVEGIDADQIDEIINASLYELENYDLFAGERSLQELINPFCVETKIRCIIKTLNPGSQTQRTEFHDMVLVCPAVKPSFIYLGKCQEINFNKVFVGTRSKIVLEIQNISFERICPTISLLNPAGSYFCPGGLRKVEVDPEHIWRQPLTYAPVEFKGVQEEEYFEIHNGPTNIFLAVKGEAIVPQYEITPCFACCRVETKIGYFEEVKIEIENLNSLKLRVQLVTDFVKVGLDSDKCEEVVNVVEEKDAKKGKTGQKEDSKGKKKFKNTESDKKNLQMWEKIPDTVLCELETFADVTNEESYSKVFTLLGLDGNNEVVVPPLGKLPFKIRYTPQKKENEKGEPGAEKKYAVKYKFMLERLAPLKEILLIGLISKK